MRRVFSMILLFGVSLFVSGLAHAAPIAGTYFAILNHGDTGFYQQARITLRTVNPDGNLRISANVQLFFGEPDSNEFLTYDFQNIDYNLLTGQMDISNDSADISMIGILRNGRIEGEWFSQLVGLVGTFDAQKGEYPEPPSADAVLVRSLSGRYLGSLAMTSDQANLPERVTMSFVTTQDTTGDTAIHITGFSRFYLGEFDSREYIELEFVDIQFNFFSRFLTAKTSAADYGLTFKGYVNEDGTFEGKLYSDGLGEIGDLDMKKEL